MSPLFYKYLWEVQEREPNTKEETIEVPLEICQVERIEEHSVQDKKKKEVMKDNIPCVMEQEVSRNSLLMEMTMVVTWAEHAEST